MYCKNCGAFVSDDNAFCTRCGAPGGAGQSYCANCGLVATPGDQVCGRCGSPLTGGTPPGAAPGTPGAAPYLEPKSRVVAGLLGVLLGYLGIHSFYLGDTNKGILQLLLGTVGGFLTCGIATAAVGIWGLVEGIMIFTGNTNTDARGVPLKD